MDTTEVTSEGALIHFTRYDLELLHNVLTLVGKEADAAAFEEESGSALIDVQRMLEKVKRTYTQVIET